MPKFIDLFSLILKISGVALTSLRNFGNMKNLLFSWLRNVFFCYITRFNWFQEIRLFSYRNFDYRLWFIISISNFVRPTWWRWLFLISAGPIIRNIRVYKSSSAHSRTSLRNGLWLQIITLWNLESSTSYLNLSRLLDILIQNFVFFLDLL